MSRHVRQSCKIATSEEGMAKLIDHTLHRQMAELRAQNAEQNAKIDRLTELLEKQLAVGPRVMNVGTTTQVNTGPVTNTQNIIHIHPWDGERRINVSTAQVAAAFAENARLREYASSGDHALADPETAPPYVTELLMDLVKRGHSDPAARNVYLNPRRADQVLVHMRSGQWEVMPLTDATRLLFDGVAATIHKVALSYAEARALPMEAQNALAVAGMLYDEEPDEYVKRAKGQMTAHLTNMVPARPE